LFSQDNLIQRLIAAGTAQFVAYFLAVEHAGDLPEQFQVCIGGGLRDQQHEQQVDRGTVDGVEIDGSVQVQQGADRCLAAFEAAVRNGDAVTKTGRAEFSRAIRAS